MLTLETPALLLSQPKMAANIARMQQRMAALARIRANPASLPALKAYYRERPAP